MNFVRFSGEWFIYYALIAFGGGVLMAFTMFIFQAIGLDAEWLVQFWVMPCGIVGAVIVAAWLVEAKQSVIENMAPVLTMLFTPLFTLLLLAFLGTMAWTGSGIDVEREVLIGFDLMLVLVVGLLLYAISARDPQAEPGLLRRAPARAGGLRSPGGRPRPLGHRGADHRVRVQPEQGRRPGRERHPDGEPGLVGGALRAVRRTGALAFGLLERWQTSYLPVYLVWMWVVVVVFPVVFGFR